MDIIIGFLQKIPPFVGMLLLTKAWPLLNQSVTYKCLTNSDGQYEGWLLQMISLLYVTANEARGLESDITRFI